MAVRKIETELTLTGEKQFNDQMKAVNSNLKTLKSEMSLVTSEFQGQANSADALREKQRVLTDQYDQQREKVKALEAQLEKARESYGDNSAQVDRYQQQLNTAKVQLNGFSRELDDTNRYLAEAESSADGAATSIDEFGRQVKQTGDKLDSANGAGGTGGLGGFLGSLGELKGLLVGGALIGALKEAGDAILDIAQAGAAYADDVLTMSTVTSLSTETLQEFMYMTDLIDVSVDTLTGSLTRLTRNMENARDGTGTQAEAFQRLGISVTDTDGSLRDARDVFYEVIDALGAMENETERDATAMAIMGKSAQELNPLIEAGSETINDFRQEAKDMGAVLDEETLATLGAMQDSFDRLKQKTTVCKNQIAVEFAPIIIKAVNEIGAAFDTLTSKIINAWNWLTQTKVGADYKTGTYSNITGSYTDPDEEFYSTDTSYLDKIKNGDKALTTGSGSRSGGSTKSVTAAAGSAQVVANVTLELDGDVLARKQVFAGRDAAEKAGNSFIE